jgi:hypothetical protein
VLDVDSLTIPLTRGKVAIIDAADFDLVGQHKWCAIPSRSTWYAMRAIRRTGPGRLVSMHQVLYPAPPGMKIDHIDGDGLNNRRANLRHCTNQENCRNQGLARNNRSGFKGVSWHSYYGKWLATIRDGGRWIYLGRFTDPVEAAHAYEAEARELFGAFARLNFPD